MNDTTAAQVEVVVHYCETGDTQHFSFKTWPLFADLVEQIREYAEPGISCNSIVLLQLNGSFYTSKTSQLTQDVQQLVLYMFSRTIILDPQFTSKATPPHHHLNDDDMDEQILSDLRENYMHRIAVQVEAGEILRLHASKELERFAYKPNAEAVYMPYALLMTEDFNQISTYLERLNLVETNTELGRTLLDAINLDQFQILTNMTQQRHLVIERSMQDLRTEEAKLRDALESSGGELEWQCATSPSSGSLAELKSTQAKITSLLFTLLRNVARFDVQMQAYKKHLFFLQEHIATQRQFLNEVTKIKLFPETYKACLVEAERRRQFATRYSASVSRISQHLARDRDRELELREQFYQKTYKLLPVAGLIPGLEATGVLPPVEINQRPIDPMLFTHIKALLPSTNSTLLAEAEQTSSSSGGWERELSAVEILELQAENELLRGGEGGNVNALTKLKQQHAEEIQALEQRIRELEEFTGHRAKPEAQATRSNASYMQFEEDPD